MKPAETGEITDPAGVPYNTDLLYTLKISVIDFSLSFVIFFARIEAPIRSLMFLKNSILQT